MTNCYWVAIRAFRVLYIYQLRPGRTVKEIKVIMQSCNQTIVSVALGNFAKSRLTLQV